MKTKIAEICGAIIGDGWIESSEKGLYITGHPKDDKDYYDNHLVPLFSRVLFPVRPRYYHYWRVYGIGVYKKEIIKKFLKLGIKKGKKANNVTFPKWVFSKKDFMISVLRGIFDTDGNFNCKKCYGKYDNNFRKKYHCQPRIEIIMSSKNLIKQIFIIAKKLGFHPGKIEIRKANKLGDRKKSEAYRIRINRLNEIKNWFEVFELSSNSKHVSKYMVWRKYGFCPPKLSNQQRNLILAGKINPYSYYECGEQDSNLRRH